MSIRVGESWQARNGHRRWVSMPLHDAVFLGGLTGFGYVFFVLPFLLIWWCLAAELWLCAESLLLIVTGIAVLWALGTRKARFGNVRVSRLRWGLFRLELR